MANSIRGILLFMKTWVMRTLRHMTLEDTAVAVFGATFFVGVWYALPMVNTITDVWAFGGGVLRAMEAHTLLPGSGVDYGTLSFYQNYLAFVLALGFGYMLSGFDLEALKTVLILNPSYSLLVHFGHMYYLYASILAFAVSIAVSFTMQKFWTFRDKPLHDMHTQFARYLVVILSNLLLNTALVYFLVEHAGVWYLFAQILATAIIAVVGYFGYRYFVFRDRTSVASS